MKTPEGNHVCGLKCFQYWCENPFSPIFICPGCIVYTGSDGLTYRALNTEACCKTLVDFKNKQEAKND